MSDPSLSCRSYPLLRRLLSGGFGATIILAVALPAMADLQFVPTLTVSERYDSNILFTASGQGNQDFVTSVSPALNVNYRGRPLTATLTGGAFFASYAKNTNFNYTSVFGTASVDLSELVGRLDKRAQLRITESVSYTPELPAFVSATAGFNPFATGIQPQRARSFTSLTSVTGGYTLTSRVSLSANYGYSYLKFGNTIGAAPEESLFNSTFQTLNAGPNITLTPTDTLSLQYQYSRADFGGDVPGFHTQGGTVGLTHQFSQRLSGNASAGVTQITPSDRVTPIFNLSASWRERNTTATISFVRSVTPSFFISASALESNVLAVSVLQGLTDSLSGSVGVNFAHSSSVSGTTVGASGTTATGSSLTFDSFGTDLSLSYTINRMLRTTFTYSHSNFQQESGDLSSSFHRDVVTISLSASWM